MPPKFTFNRTKFEKAGLTQRAVARKLGIDEAYLSKIATGKIEPSVTKAIQIAKTVGCKAEDLWETKSGRSSKKKRRR